MSDVYSLSIASIIMFNLLFTRLYYQIHTFYILTQCVFHIPPSHSKNNNWPSQILIIFFPVLLLKLLLLKIYSKNLCTNIKLVKKTFSVTRTQWSYSRPHYFIDMSFKTQQPESEKEGAACLRKYTVLPLSLIHI